MLPFPERQFVWRDHGNLWAETVDVVTRQYFSDLEKNTTAGLGSIFHVTTSQHALICTYVLLWGRPCAEVANLGPTGQIQPHRPAV